MKVDDDVYTPTTIESVCDMLASCFDRREVSGSAVTLLVALQALV